MRATLAYEPRPYAVRLPDPHLLAVPPLRRRPRPEQCAALEADRPHEEAVLVRQPGRLDRLPGVLLEALEPVGLVPVPVAADLPPDGRLLALPPHLREWQPEGLQRRLPAIVREEEPAL